MKYEVIRGNRCYRAAFAAIDADAAAVTGLFPEDGEQCIACWFEPEAKREELRKELGFPDNCRIDAVSQHVHFASGKITLRLECPDFRPIKEGDDMPEVRTDYEDGKFVRFQEIEP